MGIQDILLDPLKVPPSLWTVIELVEIDVIILELSLMLSLSICKLLVAVCLSNIRLLTA